MSYTYDYPRPMVTVDSLIFSIKPNSSKILLIQRDKEPFEGFWALPGGFIEMDETLLESAIRELQEETGLYNIELTQLYTFGNPGRDPRGRTITTVFYGFADEEKVIIKADSDARNANWFDIKNLPKLAFDHNIVVEYAIKNILKV